MSIQNQIDGLADDISAAYDAVAEMGGTVPEEGGSVNLPEAIRSIPTNNEASNDIMVTFQVRNTSNYDIYFYYFNKSGDIESIYVSSKLSVECTLTGPFVLHTYGRISLSITPSSAINSRLLVFSETTYVSLMVPVAGNLREIYVR